MNYKLIAGFLLAWLIFQSVYIVGVRQQLEANRERVVSEIENRIALDLSRLNLPNPQLNHMGNRAAVETYIGDFNAILAAKSIAARLDSVEGIRLNNEDAGSRLEERILAAPNREIHIKISHLVTPWIAYLSVWPWVFALVVSLLLYPHISKRRKVSQTLLAPEHEAEPAILVVDLKNKTLAHSEGGKPVALANKPLCFYLALVEYCVQYPDSSLNQNKDVPPELIDLAHKYFHRLIELGHTIRKRPNFSSSLEKTLSEIRAALDETMVDQPDRKELYYPPKAHGEGSRSRLHHYGLTKISADMIRIIGK